MPKQNVALELYYNGTWNNLVTADEVFADAPITIRRGLGDESGGWPRPAVITARLDNATDKYRTTNPESPLYGLAGRNTPMRASVGGTVRGIVEASSWTADQTPSFRQTPRRGKAWVDVTGGGLLQRVGQRNGKIGSPFRRFNERNIANLAGYWPCEDENGATQAFSTVPGAVNTFLLGTTFGSQQRPPGSDTQATVVLQDGATFTFTGGDSDATNGWQYGVLAYMTGPATFFTVAQIHTLAEHHIFFNLNITDQTINMLVTYQGATLINSTFGASGYNWLGRWFSFVIDTSYSGGTVTVTFKWRAVDENGYASASDTYSGITSNLDRAFGGGFPDGSAFGHVIGTHGRVDDLASADRFTALLGHAGEVAAVRFGRLLDEEIGSGNYYVSAGYAGSMPMGPQRNDTLPNLIKETIQTEDALVYDYAPDLRVQFTARVDRYRQTPALELIPTDLPALPKEVNDDKVAGNVVTASQRDGGDYTVRDDTGPLGTQPPPDGVGEEARTVDVNLDDESLLPQVANWWLRRGTVDLPRFPQVAIDLNANPGIISDVEAVDVGSVITIDGFRENVIRLIVLGWTETIGTHSRTIVFTCVPDQQFQVGKWDATDSRWDAANSVVVNAPTSSDTTVKIGTGEVAWSTTTPYNLAISGEEVTVTAMSAPTGSTEIVSGAFDSGADLAAWGATNGTLALSSTFAHGGSFSALLTVTGTPTTAWARVINHSSCPAVVPGAAYSLSIWVRSAVNLTDVRVLLEWLDAAGATIASVNSGLAALTSGSWVQRTITGAAAADGAVYVRYGVQLGGSPATGTLLYLDDAVITTDASIQNATVTRSVNGVSKALPPQSAVHVSTPGRWAL